MDHAWAVGQLARHRDVFHALLTGLGDDEVRWRPEPGKWCVLEVVCHLHDEEREDFRARLRSVLEAPAAALPPIDPVGWVTSRRYLEQPYAATLDRFLAERDASLRWLRGLERPAWTNAHPHPRFGPMSAELFLANWVAHDMHHLRQVNALRHDWLAHAGRQPLDYAGRW